MTVVNVVPAVVALATGSVATAGSFTAIPWRGTTPAVVTAGPTVIFPEPVMVALSVTGPAAPIDLVPGDGTWCWAVTVTVGTQSVTRYVQVPASGPVNWGALVDVDPTTFIPTPSVVTGWAAAISSLQPGGSAGNINKATAQGVALMQALIFGGN